eukprot:c26920_g1_i1 orf=1-198(-)
MKLVKCNNYGCFRWLLTQMIIIIDAQYFPLIKSTRYMVWLTLTIPYHSKKNYRSKQTPPPTHTPQE